MRDIMKTRGPFVCALLLCSALPMACSSFLDPDEYDLLAPFEDLPFSQVIPSSLFDLWELREGVQGGPHHVIARGGSLDRSAVPPTLLAAFDETKPPNGFDSTCLPGHCFKYFVSLRGTSIETWTSLNEARAFLGTIDNRIEAAVLAKANGFYWQATKKAAAIRDVPGGYELSVLALVKFCAPIQSDRFLLRIDASGGLTVLKREVWEVDDEACF